MSRAAALAPLHLAAGLSLALILPPAGRAAGLVLGVAVAAAWIAGTALNLELLRRGGGAALLGIGILAAALGGPSETWAVAWVAAVLALWELTESSRGLRSLGAISLTGLAAAGSGNLALLLAGSSPPVPYSFLITPACLVMALLMLRRAL